MLNIKLILTHISINLFCNLVYTINMNVEYFGKCHTILSSDRNWQRAVICKRWRSSNQGRVTRWEESTDIDITWHWHCSQNTSLELKWCRLYTQVVTWTTYSLFNMINKRWRNLKNRVCYSLIYDLITIRFTHRAKYNPERILINPLFTTSLSYVFQTI